ncbi:MAG: ABC transporter ATP-binding protein, partial [Elainellaceae cyanobacterium]
MNSLFNRFRWQRLRQSTSLFRYCGRAIALVWRTHRVYTLLFAVLTLVAGLLPAAVAYVGKLIVDAVVQAAQSGLESDRWL